MDQLLKNKEFKTKLASLSPGVKQWMIESLIDLFEQESEYVIDVLEDCRVELGHTAETYVEEAEHLRATSRMLEERRDDNGRSASRASLSAPLRLPVLSGQHAALTHRRRERTRMRMCISDGDDRSPSSLSLSPSSSLPPSPYAGRRGAGAGGLSPSDSPARSLSVLHRPPDAKAIEEETKALLQTMTAAESHVERERERQQERLERIRRQKKMLAEDRTAQAMKLLEKALEMDRVLAQNRDRQGQMLQNKLEGLKKRRSTIQSSHEPPPAHT
ncbi:uncharacterized protein LOC143295259 [Babylonia areolata]|uniref:uncharacterized protein LOC143295259 n=1 Tax=Babylonia areolata TaxID=304850 RepID=UPI003FD32A7B